MPTTLNIPNIDVQSNKLVITDNPVVIDSDGYGTTPLADVDAETSADTILGVKDGAVVQIEPDDLKDDLGIDALETNATQFYSDTFTGTGISFTVVRQGCVAVLNASSGQLSADVGANTAFATIPTGYRPRGTDIQAWEVAVGKRIGIGTSGSITCTTALSTNAYIRFTATYICEATLPS